MKEFIEIPIPNGTLTIKMTALPAPGADLKKILRMANEAGVDAASTSLAWVQALTESAERGFQIYEQEQKNTLQLFHETDKQRDKDRAELKAMKDKKRYAQEIKILKQNIKDETRRLQDLRDARAQELRARNDYLRQMDYLKRNKELIEKWQDQKRQRSLTSLTEE